MEISKKHSKRDRSPTDAYMKAFRKIYPDMNEEYIDELAFHTWEGSGAEVLKGIMYLGGEGFALSKPLLTDMTKHVPPLLKNGQCLNTKGIIE
ncbi:MAG: hypothetical protein WCR55_14165 [Lentisphaerota bacterium]